MIAPNIVHFSTEPQRSVIEALVKKVAKNAAERLVVDAARRGCRR